MLIICVPSDTSLSSLYILFGVSCFSNCMLYVPLIMLVAWLTPIGVFEQVVMLSPQ